MGELLDEFLLKHHASKDTVPNGLYNKLIQVESEICLRKSNIEAAKMVINSNAINVKSISESTDISRKTFYNNKLLNDFVLENSTASNETKKELKKAKIQLQELKEKIKKLVSKDIDINELRNTIEELQTDLNRANERIKALEAQLETNTADSKQPEDIYHYNIN